MHLVKETLSYAPSGVVSLLIPSGGESDNKNQISWGKAYISHGKTVEICWKPIVKEHVL